LRIADLEIKRQMSEDPSSLFELRRGTQRVSIADWGLRNADFEDRRQMSEDRRQKSEDRGQTTEDRGQTTEGRRQKAEGFDCGLRIADLEVRRQRTDDRRQKWEVGPVVVRYGGTMPRLKMWKWEMKNFEKIKSDRIP